MEARAKRKNRSPYRLGPISVTEELKSTVESMAAEENRSIAHMVRVLIVRGLEDGSKRVGGKPVLVYEDGMPS